MTFKRTNPLALAVLALLSERPMHPYEMAQTMRERHQEEVIKLNYGSLYTVVESLHRHELITASAVQKAGNRPERTVYAVTAAGTTELHDWLRELIAVPAREYPRFEAGISLVGLLPPADALQVVAQREAAVGEQLTALAVLLEKLAGMGLPQLAWIELDYRMAMLRAERAWLAWFATATREGTVGGYQDWEDRHR
ncbi:PadR family transcriptional regulator [Lentzea flaviverrucosa]|uniref:Transcriptional regulator PadR-like family protein n=1 Tax=Lentzea flaviverrucosa TaxID=200379 RepID=A0A1H9ALA9_9PSEU|nr:PadR family transcriptional regulator [Lentzea flaviverrucosa]RDI32032.1 PadR family transcriptional regulator [Lentzea flaviverrucosa]SEP77449.1 Transcriptional regulator PadR-like family protein [Lentzea flaviverrucosa]